MASSVPFQMGDSVPYFTGNTSINPQFRFGSLGGRYIVLSFLGGAGLPASQTFLKGLQGSLKSLFSQDFAVFCGVTVTGNAMESESPFFFFQDNDYAISQQYNAMPVITDKQKISYNPFTLVLDPNLRVIRSISLLDPNHNAVLEKTLKSLPPVEQHAGTPLHAPVLIIPRVFEPEFCTHLIDLYKRNGGTRSGTMREGQDGFTMHHLDDNFKRRKDYNIEDEALKTAFRARIQRAIIPEIKKAFQFNATYIERYLIACYDSKSQGFFRPHRDNTTKGTAHRRFACTINLNAEDFEGGTLRFPEFGQRTYKAPTGGAVIFSCSLLHEATPVTKGERYAALPFFYDESGAKIRQENLKYLKTDGMPHTEKETEQA